MHRIATLLAAVALPMTALLVPASSTAAPETAAVARAAAIGAPYYGESPKPIAKKLGLTPAGAVKSQKGVQQLTTDAAIITTYPSKKLQAKAAAATEKVATETGVTFHTTWAKGVMILVLDNLPETAAALAAQLPGGKVKVFAP
ncbi:hypothetical protein SFC79_11550 [Nocardioides sp. S-58]|uniref:Inhibitor I9 domain-containing protein n=1 Tax=Nocardioides renjunii TaxID=3095075 RepID=A0ABU5KBR0_9ACTN|nr:hypothetical protein [Nocardioides sp. S-58]MDZ5662399.1 hypothetical protein [Nocardioides sp. S-58]